jgi:hypothetical protein
MARRGKKTASTSPPDSRQPPLRELVESLDRTRERLDVVLEEVRRTPPSTTRSRAGRGSGVYNRRVGVLVVGERTRARRWRIVELMAERLDVMWATDLVDAATRCAVDPPEVIVLDQPRMCVQEAALQRLSACGAHIVLISQYPVTAEVRDRCAVVIREPCDAVEIAAVVRGLAGIGGHRST